jgi:hypothetical protein
MQISDAVFIAVLLLLAVSVFGVIFAYPRSTYTSPGTLVQLATSHVPTEQDVYYNRYIYPQIVRRDIQNMTEDVQSAPYTDIYSYRFLYPQLVRRELTEMTGEDPGVFPPDRLALIERST